MIDLSESELVYLKRQLDAARELFRVTQSEAMAVECGRLWKKIEELEKGE